MSPSYRKCCDRWEEAHRQTPDWPVPECAWLPYLMDRLGLQPSELRGMAQDDLAAILGWREGLALAEYARGETHGRSQA